jgi:hypothetical protein
MIIDDVNTINRKLEAYATKLRFVSWVTLRGDLFR